MKSIIKFASLVVVSFAITACNKGTSHHVDFSTEHGKWDGSSAAYEGTNYVATFVPEQGYELKGASLYVVVGGNRLSNEYTFYNNRLTIFASAIVGDIKITANASAIEYDIVNDIKNATIGSAKAKHNQTLELEVKARDYYTLPESIKVYVGEDELQSGYTYLPDDNKLIIDGEYITNTITLSGDSIQLYLVKFNSTSRGAWKDGATFKDVFVKKGTTFGEAKELVAKPDANEDAKEFDFWGAEDITTDPIDDDTKIEKYGFNVYGQYRPVVLNVSGQSQYGFDWDGLLRGKKTTSYGSTYNLTVDFLPHPAPKKLNNSNVAHNLIFNGANCTADNSKTYEAGATVEFNITPEIGYTLPSKDKVTVTGLSEEHPTFTYTVDSKTGIAAFSCTMPDNDVMVSLGSNRIYYMPEAIKITAFNRKQSKDIVLDPKAGDYSIVRAADGSHIDITVNPTGTIGDLTIQVNPYFEANITFDPNGGTWSEGGSAKKTAIVKSGSPDSVKFNILEASRLKLANPIIESPTKSGQVFDYWYDVDKEERVDVNNIVSDNLNLKAIYTDPTFETDTWANVKTYANQGSAALLSHYGKTSASDLIACTRNIVIGNDTLGYTQQKILVIDMDHDELPKSTEQNPLKATLTFMFQKVCSTSVFDDETSRPQHNRWEGSTLRSASALTSYIPDLSPVPVKKTTYFEIQGASSGYYNTTDAFFPFSQNELNLTSASGSDVKDEGSPYAYFRDMGGSLKRDSVLTDDSSYWLRSPYHIDTSNNYSYYIDEDGNVEHDRYNNSHGILVGFCIGETAAP